MGAAIAADLVLAGAWVVAIDVKTSPDLPPLGDGEARMTYRNLDVTNEPGVRQALTDVVEQFGRLDYVVCAAGVGWFDRDRSIVTSERSVWDAVMHINLTGAMVVSLGHEIGTDIPAGTRAVIDDDLLVEDAT